ncbi:uncharacterized protein LOC143788322 [Ranitomeya variabilis]|uniref:uncharacterized protein LOC143788322 n=1 Tax=Ranitomeya variabilis TaxID=490064 RepID=UPI004057BCC1
MKIRKVMLAVMICAYGQITNTSHDEEFIDPMDMEHYDQSTKSMKFTLKAKKSLELFQGLLQGLLKRADEHGLNAVMDIDIGLEINKFLNNENWDSNKMQIILENVVFTDPKDDLEKESVELFKGFLQRLLNSADERGLNTVMDIDIRLEINKFLNNENWDSNKIQIILENVAFTIPQNDLETESVELFKGFLQRLLNSADERGLKAIMDIDMKMEINKFLNNENWDSDKLKIILENVAIPKDKEDWLVTLVVGGVILCILTLLMKLFYWSRPVQNEVINEAEEPEDDNDYIEDQISTPTPETGQNVPYLRSERRSDPGTEQTKKDKCPRQHSQTSHKFSQTQDEDLDESHEQKNFISAKVNRADSLMYRNEEHDDTSNAEEFSLFQTLEATGRNDCLESISSENQTPADILQDEDDDLYSEFPSQKSHLYKNQSVVQACLSRQISQRSSSSNEKIKDNACVESDQTLSHTTLPNYAIECTRREIQTKPGTLKDEEESDGALNRNMESFGQTCFCLLSNVEKMEDKNPVKNKAVSHALSSEKKQMVTILGAKESTGKSNYNLELLSSDTEGSSETQVNVDTVLSTHHSQDSSMIVDDESDFIVLSESAPESLTFINVGACDECL